LEKEESVSEIAALVVRLMMDAEDHPSLRPNVSSPAPSELESRSPDFKTNERN
jgi:hypothetical protein